MSLGDFIKKIAAPVGTFLGGPVGAAAGAAVSGIWSAREASKQRRFQGYMAGTSHQREVADLRAAGLNPILSATGGSGAATPSGAMPVIPNLGQAAMSGYMLRQQAALNAASIKKLEAETENTDSSTRLNNWQYMVNREFGPLEKQASLWEVKTRIKEAIQRTTSTAQDVKRKDAELRELLQDPVLVRYALSSGAGDQAQLDKLLKSGDRGDIAAFLLRLLRR